MDERATRVLDEITPERVVEIASDLIRIPSFKTEETQLARWLDGYLWLRQQAAHPRIRRVEMGVFRDYGHLFRLIRPDDVDEELADLLQEAYVLGCEI